MLPPIEKFTSGEIKTLGWGVLDWCSKWLVNPDSKGGGTEGARWVFKPDQVHFILAYYAVDENGDWLYMKGYRERAKGTGKTPHAAAMCCAELLGPVLFSHFDKDGNPVGRENPDAMVWICGTSWASVQHTYYFATGMLSGPAKDEFSIDVGKTRIEIYGNAKRRIQVITSRASANEGPSPSFAVCEETQHWLPGDHYDKLYETITQSVAKTSVGRLIEVTNTPMPGEMSVAEATHKHYEMILAGEAEPDLLFDTLGFEIKNIYDESEAIPVLEEVYKDAPWSTPKHIFRTYSQPGYREFTARRFFFNQKIISRALWITDTSWDDCEDLSLKLKKKDLISIGFRFRLHCAAIVAVRLRDQAVFVLKKWEKPSSAGRNWEVSYRDVDNKMRQILDTHNVYNLFGAPQNFQEILGRWSSEYQNDVVVEDLPVRSGQKWADCIEMFETAVNGKRLIHSGDPDLTRQVMNCFVEEIPQGRMIRPETDHSSRYIVMAEAAVLAYKAYKEAVEDGALDRPDNTLFSF